MARIDYLERHAGGYQRLRDEGIESLVLESHVRFLQPARFDDRLVVHARCLDVRGARFRFEYAITRDGTTIADGWTRARHRRRHDAPADAPPRLARRGGRYCGGAGAVVVVASRASASAPAFAFAPTAASLPALPGFTGFFAASSARRG